MMDSKAVMPNVQFQALSDELLHKIIDEVEARDPTGLIACDLYENMISMSTSSGQYLINRNADVQEMWLSSPISGPAHFTYRLGRWISSKDKDLLNILEQELSNILAINVKF